MPYKRQELLTLSGFNPVFLGGICVAYHLLRFPIICLHVSRCDTHYDFRIQTIFVSSVPLVVCRGLMSYLRYLCLLLYSGVQHILCCVFVLFVFVLCTLCCQFRLIYHC